MSMDNKEEAYPQAVRSCRLLYATLKSCAEGNSDVGLDTITVLYERQKILPWPENEVFKAI